MGTLSEVTHIGPPKGLDEEDVAYFDQLENRRKSAADRRKEDEERELKAFKAAARTAQYDAPQIAHHKDSAQTSKPQPAICNAPCIFSVCIDSACSD